MIGWERTTSRLLRILRLETVRNKLLAFAVLATLIPSMSTAWITYVQNKGALTAKIAQELRSVSSQAARELDLWIKERIYELRVFANSDAVLGNVVRLPAGSAPLRRSPAQGRLTDYLNSVRGRFPDYEELMVVDPEGRVIATTAKHVRAVALPPGWQTTIKNDRPAFGAPYWDYPSGKAAMIAAVPIRQTGGRLLGAVAARLNLVAVEAALRHSPAGDSGRVYLMAAAGELITSSRSTSPESMKQKLPSETVKRLMAHEGAAVEYRGYESEKVLGALTQVQQLGWSVVAGIPSAEAYRQINRLRNVTALLVSGLLVAVGLIAYLLGLLIVRPLDRLREAAAGVAAGDFAVDLPVMGGGEVGYLTEVFNNMVARLREGRQQLDSINETLRAKNEELERLSITDSLTGLHNRRHLMDRLASEVSRARRHGHGFSLLMVDVDHFKRYNDAHGHMAGDEVLVRLAKVLRESTREVDCAARYGGEEFLVLLPETSMEAAVEIAERIRTKLGEERLAGGRVTVSIGVAAFPEFGESAEAIIMSADAALYQAKREGRDRVVRCQTATEVEGPA